MITQTAEARSILSQELYSRWRQGEPVEVIDVRTAVDFAEAHLPMARPAPWETLDPREVMQSRQGTGDEPLYIVCQIGKRSAQACQRFLDAGFDQVVNVEGGTEAWLEAGLPVERAKGVIGIRRQVQIAAGSLVFIGSVLGLLWHPWFGGIAALVGAGLIFAGATNTCAMGSILARMPWNR